MGFFRSNQTVLVRSGAVVEGNRVREIGGSRQHFFHFLLGYLLPSVGYIRSGNRSVRWLNCGPTLTPRLREFLSWAGQSRFITRQPAGRQTIELAAFDNQSGNDAELKLAIESVRELAPRTVTCRAKNCPETTRLLINRQSSPRFYKAGGRADIAGYGTTRRSIANISELSAQLWRNNIGHDVYTPGEHSLACQIEAFSRATHISGSYGAEWGNVVWTSESVRCRILKPQAMTEDRSIENLAAKVNRFALFTPVESPHPHDDGNGLASFFTHEVDPEPSV